MLPGARLTRKETWWHSGREQGHRKRPPSLGCMKSRYTHAPVCLGSHQTRTLFTALTGRRPDRDVSPGSCLAKIRCRSSGGHWGTGAGTGASALAHSGLAAGSLAGGAGLRASSGRRCRAPWARKRNDSAAPRTAGVPRGASSAALVAAVCETQRYRCAHHTRHRLPRQWWASSEPPRALGGFRPIVHRDGGFPGRSPRGQRSCYAEPPHGRLPMSPARSWTSVGAWPGCYVSQRVSAMESRQHRCFQPIQAYCGAHQARAESSVACRGVPSTETPLGARTG